jgi:DNA polymerase
MTNSLFSLSEEIRRCAQCPLWKNRTLAVPGEGPKDAALMIVGEAPSAEEDHQGIPFIGRTGKFLKAILKEYKINQENVFMTGAVKCKPQANRTPKKSELETCKELWLDKQIEVLKPKIIILLGSTALWSLLKEKDLARIHGKIIEKDNQKYFVTYHPSAAMRFPKIKLLMEKDLQELNEIIETL